MNKVKFDYDIKKNAWWWAKLARDKELWGMDWKKEVAPIPDKLVGKMNKVSLEKAEKFALEHLKSSNARKYIEEVIKEEIKVLESVWSKKEDLFFKKIEELFEEKMYRKKFTGYFTTLFMCPYNVDEYWFMISFWHSLPFQIGTICHEIFHLQFIYYWRNYLIKEKKISWDKYEEIKEALVIILNEDLFSDIILIEEQGYPNHQATIKRIEKLRKQGKNIKEVVDSLV